MFTGIVEEMGVIKEIAHGARSSTITINARKVLADVKIGDSINTNGICLTVVTFGKESFSVDVMPETLRRTSLGQLKTGSPVNLERALRLSDRLGGHLVSGHIDGTGTINRRWEEDNAIWFTITTDLPILRYIVEKGSVAIDGISLTVARVDSKSFGVSIIPHTQEVTTLLSKSAGDLVNIECDVIAKYIEKLTQNKDPKRSVDRDFLLEHGF